MAKPKAVYAKSVSGVCHNFVPNKNKKEMQLQNSTILVTGATSGIGLEFVKQLTALGATVLVTGRNPAALEATKKQFPQVHTFRSDVSKPQDIDRLYHDVTRQFPELNIIINNAGIMRLIDLRDSHDDLEDLTQEIGTNLTGTIQLVQRFLPHLMAKEWAGVVNISSAISYMAYSAAPIYSASKAGVHAYTRALRLQLENTGVKVFEVIPPGVNTNLQNDWTLKPNPGQMMDVDKMVRAAIKGLLKDKKEITPGLAGLVKYMARIAPGFIEKNLGHRDFYKLKQDKK